MAKSKTSGQSTEHSFLEKVSEQAAHLKEVIVEGKDHVMEAAGGALESIKEKIHEIREHKGKKVAAKKRKTVSKRPVAKKMPKKVTKKVAKKAVKRVAKKAPKKSAKKTVGKSRRSK